MYYSPLINYLLLFQGEGFDVMKSGDARVALIGFPSVGKVSEFCFLHIWFVFIQLTEDALMLIIDIFIFIFLGRIHCKS